MSDERFEQLGIPRRRFLKASAAAAFAAPVVVSFGLDGMAEAHGHGHSMPNQSCPNMTNSYQHAVAEEDLVELIGLIVAGVRRGQIGRGLGNSLCQKALQAALQLAGGQNRGACAKIDSLRAQLERHPATSPMTFLAEAAWVNAGCACFPSHHG